MTPPPKKKEPTPDLTDIIPVLERKRRMTQWDIKPPGYENVTAEQAKLSGMFPLPGAPRQQAMDPTKLQAFMSQPGGASNSAVLKPTNSRQAKRLVVENLPPSVTEDAVVSFMNLQLNGLNIMESTDPCVGCQISGDRSFALVEFRNSSEATVAYALDGIAMEADDATDGNGTTNGGSRGLVIRRPKDYIVPAVVDDTGYEPGVVSSVLLDTPNKLSIANIPMYLTDEQVTELLVSFGELKAFILVKDRETEESRVSPPVIRPFKGELFLSGGDRELLSASTSSQAPLRSPCKASTAWSWEIGDSGSRRPASALHKLPGSRWGSMPCLCLQGRHPPTPRSVVFSSC